MPWTRSSPRTGPGPPTALPGTSVSWQALGPLQRTEADDRDEDADEVDKAGMLTFLGLVSETTVGGIPRRSVRIVEETGPRTPTFVFDDFRCYACGHQMGLEGGLAENPLVVVQRLGEQALLVQEMEEAQ